MPNSLVAQMVDAISAKKQGHSAQVVDFKSVLMLEW